MNGHSRLSGVLIECASALDHWISTDALGEFMRRRGYWTPEGKRAAKLLADKGGSLVQKYLVGERTRLKTMEGELGRLIARASH